MHLTVAFALELFLLLFFLGVLMSLSGSVLLTIIVTIVGEGIVHAVVVLFIIQKPASEPASTRPMDQIASYIAFINTQDVKRLDPLEDDIVS